MMAGLAVGCMLLGFVMAAMAGAHLEARDPMSLRIGSAGGWTVAALLLLVLALFCAHVAGAGV